MAARPGRLHDPRRDTAARLAPGLRRNARLMIVRQHPANLELAGPRDKLARERNSLCRLLRRERLRRDAPRQSVRIACRNVVLIELACGILEVSEIRPR